MHYFIVTVAAIHVPPFPYSITQPVVLNSGPGAYTHICQRHDLCVVHALCGVHAVPTNALEHNVSFIHTFNVLMLLCRECSKSTMDHVFFMMMHVKWAEPMLIKCTERTISVCSLLSAWCRSRHFHDVSQCSCSWCRFFLSSFCCLLVALHQTTLE